MTFDFFDCKQNLNLVPDSKFQLTISQSSIDRMVLEEQI